MVFALVDFVHCFKDEVSLTVLSARYACRKTLPPLHLTARSDQKCDLGPIIGSGTGKCYRTLDDVQRVESCPPGGRSIVNSSTAIIVARPDDIRKRLGGHFERQRTVPEEVRQTQMMIVMTLRKACHLSHTGDTLDKILCRGRYTKQDLIRRVRWCCGNLFSTQSQALRTC